MDSLNKEFILEGLCCGNCAAKIERDVENLEGIVDASIDLTHSILQVKLDERAEADSLTEEIARIAAAHDEDIIVKARGI